VVSQNDTLKGGDITNSLLSLQEALGNLYQEASKIMFEMIRHERLIHESDPETARMSRITLNELEGDLRKVYKDIETLEFQYTSTTNNND
jgi:hypothetical protein